MIRKSGSRSSEKIVRAKKISAPIDSVEIDRALVTRERQCARAAKVGRRIPRDRVGGQMVIRHPFEEAAYCDLRHEPRHLAAETKVLARAEAEMSQRPAVDVVPVGVGEFAVVAIARAE